MKDLLCFRFGTVCLIFLLSRRLCIKMSSAGYLFFHKDSNLKYYKTIKKNNRFLQVSIFSFLTFPLAISSIAKFFINEYSSNPIQVEEYLLETSNKATIIDTDLLIGEYYRK